MIDRTVEAFGHKVYLQKYNMNGDWKVCKVHPPVHDDIVYNNVTSLAIHRAMGMDNRIENSVSTWLRNWVSSRK